MFHIVLNQERQRSLWPDYHKHTLPKGWAFNGFSGTKEECLLQIANSPIETSVFEAKPSKTLELPPAQNVVLARSRAIAVPFARRSATFRLFVFPHAGAGASSYHFLARACKHQGIELNLIQYPGREMRIREQPCGEMGSMVRSLEEDLRPLFSEKPFMFFGHSMGALVSFELARSLAANGGPVPMHLFLSGRQAPHLPALNLPVDSMSDDAFLDAVGRRYNALPVELLANPEIMALVLPSLRADFKLMGVYKYLPSNKLNSKITLLNGKDDPWVDVDSIAAWQMHTKEVLQSRWFPGGHFYLPDAAIEVSQLINAVAGLES